MTRKNMYRSICISECRFFLSQIVVSGYAVSLLLPGLISSAGYDGLSEKILPYISRDIRQGKCKRSRRPGERRVEAPQRPIFGILLKTQFLDRDTETKL